MSSLAILAHAGHAKAPPSFNSLFYATVAAIIPVLYLAVARAEIRLARVENQS